MKEYRIKGLSCVNCTLELEQQLKKLEHGETATLSYTSGKLKLDPLVSLPSVERILKSERAYIDRTRDAAAYQPADIDPQHSKRTHYHDHEHEA